MQCSASLMGICPASSKSQFWTREKLHLCTAALTMVKRVGRSPLLLLSSAVVVRPQPIDLPPDGDPLAGRQGEVLGGAVALAEAALYAAVNQRMRLGRGLQELQVGHRVLQQMDSKDSRTLSKLKGDWLLWWNPFARFFLTVHWNSAKTTNVV